MEASVSRWGQNYPQLGHRGVAFQVKAFTLEFLHFYND